MFDLRAYSVSDTGLPYWLSPPSPNEPHREISHQDHVHTHGKAHRHDPSHPHHNGIRTTLIPLPSLSSSQFDALNTFLEYLLWQRKLPSIASVAPITEKHSQISGTASTETAEAPEVLRTKGLVRRADNGKEYILQGVTDLFELKEIARPASVGGVAGEERTGGGDEREESRIEGKVVFIGRGVDKRLNVALHNWLNVHA
jgi:G3E family GTPase